MNTLRNIVVVTSVSLIALATSACGKGKAEGGKAGSTSLTSAEAPKGGRCLLEKAGTCTEYKGNALGLAEGACTDLLKGAYAKEACPAAELMGKCERKGDTVFYYFGGEYPWVSDAEKSCAKDGLEPGKFTASAGAEQLAKEKALPATSKILGSCAHTSLGTCEDYTGADFDMLKGLCDKFTATPCSTDKLVASCVKHGRVERLYESELKYQKMADLQKSCEGDAFPFGHFYPNPSYTPAKAAAAPAKAKAGASKAKK